MAFHPLGILAIICGSFLVMLFSYLHYSEEGFHKLKNLPLVRKSSKKVKYDPRILDEAETSGDVNRKLAAVSTLARMSKNKCDNITRACGPELDELMATQREIEDLEIQLQATRREIVSSGSMASVRRVLDVRGQELYGNKWTQGPGKESISSMINPNNWDEDDLEANQGSEWQLHAPRTNRSAVVAPTVVPPLQLRL